MSRQRSVFFVNQDQLMTRSRQAAAYVMGDTFKRGQRQSPRRVSDKRLVGHIDIVFANRDRSSPTQALEALPGRGAEHDQPNAHANQCSGKRNGGTTQAFAQGRLRYGFGRQQSEWCDDPDQNWNKNRCLGGRTQSTGALAD